MAVTNADIPRRIERTREIDLSDVTPVVPEGTMVNVTVRGSVGAFNVELERRYRWIIECYHDRGARVGELTGVYGDDGRASLPDEVPAWITSVLEVVCEVDEVKL